MYRGFRPPTPPATCCIYNPSPSIALLGQEPTNRRTNWRPKNCASSNSTCCGTANWRPVLCAGPVRGRIATLSPVARQGQFLFPVRRVEHGGTALLVAHPEEEGV